MPGLPDIYAELQRVFQERFAQPRGGHPGDALVAFAFGTPIPDDSFRLNDEARTLSPELAEEFMAAHADAVPDVRENCFIRTGRSISNQFLLLLNGAAAAQAAIEPLLGLVKAECKPLFEPVLGFKGEYRKVIATPMNWYDTSDDGNWSHVVINHQDNPPPPPPPPTSGSSGGIGGSASGTGTVIKDFLVWKRPPKVLDDIIEPPINSGVFKMSSVKALQLDRVAVQPMPSRLSTAVVQPHTIELTRTDALSTVTTRALSNQRIRTRHAIDDAVVLETSPTIMELTPDDGEALKKSFISAVEIESLTAGIRVQSTPQPVNADGFKLSLRYCLVELRRPWLSDALLSLPGWFVHGFAKGDFSRGVSENTGNLAYVPTACIVIRDVSITANWSDSDKAVLQSSVELGGFSLLGRAYDQNTQTLSIPGMQSFAWICQPMPVLPPADQPQQP